MEKMPTIRQKKAFKEVVNGSTISGAMVKAGYSESTALRTNKLTSTEGWQELMQKYMPDDKLAKKHDDLLNDEESSIQVKALDMAYKLKGSYAPDKSINLNLNADAKVNPKAAALKDEYEKKLLDAIQE